MFAHLAELLYFCTQKEQSDSKTMKKNAYFYFYFYFASTCEAEGRM